MPNILDKLLKAAQQPANERAAKYAVTLDAHLDGLPSNLERAAMLRRERDNWLARYEAFCLAVDSGRYNGTATSYDYIATLAAIEKRRAMYKVQPTPPSTEFWQGAQV